MKKTRILLLFVALFHLVPMVQAEYVLPFDVQYSSKFYSGFPIVADVLNRYFYDEVVDENYARLSPLDVIVSVN